MARHSRRSFLRIAAGSALCATPALRAVAAAPVPLTVAAIPSDVAAEAYYAERRGAFERAGLSCKILRLTNGASIAAAVVSGSANIGFSNVISLASAHLRGIPVTVLAPANLHVQGSPTAGILAVRKTSAIHGAKDLDGKIVAVTGLNNIAHIAARLWIDKNGGDSSRVRFIELPFTEMSPAIVAGRVDAAALDAIADPTAGKADDPLRRLGSTFDAVSPRFAPSVWFTTKDWAAKNSETVKSFVAIMLETARWANTHHRESAELLSGFTHRSVSAIEASTRTTYGERLTPELIQPDIDAAAKYGVIRAAFPAADLISPLA